MYMVLLSSRTSPWLTSLQLQIKSRQFTPHHYTSHHITPHHYTSHHFTPHHYTSHHFTPHHYTSHHFTYLHSILTWIPLQNEDALRMKNVLGATSWFCNHVRVIFSLMVTTCTTFFKMLKDSALHPQCIIDIFCFCGTTTQLGPKPPIFWGF